MTGGQRGVIDRRSLLPFYEQLRAILVDRLSTEMADGRPAAVRGRPVRALRGESHGGAAGAGSIDLRRLIHKIKGRGAFVVERRLEATFVQRTGGIYEEMTRRGHDVSSQVLAAGGGSRRRCGSRPSSICRSVIRWYSSTGLRFVDRQPIQVVRSTLPHRLVPGLEATELTDRSLYAVLRHRYGITGSQRQNARCGHQAPRPPDAKLLNMKFPGSPVLMVQSISTSSHGVPFEWFVAIYSGDRAQFDVDVVAPTRKRT